MTKKSMVFLALILYVVFRSFVLEPNALEVTKYEINNKQLAGTRIVFLTDFHFKKRDHKRLNNIIKLTKKQKPDLVLIGGDFARYQDSSKNMDINLIASKLSLINVPVYAVLGESDWWSDGKGITRGLKENGINVLENSSKRTVMKGKYVDIVGIADITTRQPDLNLAMYKTKKPRIVITHNPDIYYDIIDDVSLILAGHTHGGQFIFPLTPPLFVPSKFGSEFASGLIKSAHNKMIISKGIGTTGFPIRLNCKPEIVVVDFID
ncbi:MAG: metallophosphoesterase [Candidatus Gastranaerophilales bacterium]|nr:metallophosphoesterase [Candidatus Gastranaerophilales bacterium]